ncbi:MAG: hypothetical protein H0Z40_06030 [Desulfotomaculum sp.]|nr:hypothetical protein [Desulfotomaculum sp.]
MSVYLPDNKLFEFIAAIILRNNGYVAGVPRRLLGGRATRHQVNVIGIDLNTSPFSLNNIIIVQACRSENNNLDLNLVRNLKATLMDLEQTLPPQRELIRDIVGTARGDLFHRIYGKQKNREKLTVNYVGNIFINRPLSQHAWEYANAHGIYVTYIPQTLAGNSLNHWFSVLRSHLNKVVDSHGEITLPGLKKKEKKHQAVKEIINLLRCKDTADRLEAHQNHDLFTIINEVINQKEFAPLQNKLQQLALASMNGYPVVLEYNITYRNLLEAALINLSEQFNRAKSISQRTKYRSLNAVKFIIENINQTIDPNITLLSYTADSNKVPEPIKNMQGSLYVPTAVIDKRMTRFNLKLPLKTDISLVAEFHIKQK